MDFLKGFFSSKHVREWVALIALMAVVTYGVSFNSLVLQTSLLSAKQHAPFDGTVMPIQETPDWTHISRAEHSINYHDFPISKLESIPEYKTDFLTFPSEDLIWGKAAHDVIRNTKITYSVPYAGSYEIAHDHGEGAGSHPAVDIKALKGTPVYAVANGIVTKSSQQNGGFGHHIVLEHNNVPKPNNPNRLATLHSSYSHLSKVYVGEGEIVRKGEVIGEVGSTGTSTTDHLHFQLDSDLAPWHPYWPFTTSEVNKAGLNFWSAVNAGLGKDNVYKYTYNPMTWVQANLDTDAALEEVPEPTPEPEVVPEPVEVVEPDPEPEVVPEPEIETAPVVVTVGFDDVYMDIPSFVLIGNNESFNLTLLDENGDRMKNANFDGDIEVSLSNKDVAKLNQDFLTPLDFKNGTATLRLYAEREGEVRVKLKIGQRDYESLPIKMIPAVKPFARFGVQVDGVFAPGKAEIVVIQALDEDGNPTPSFASGGKIELSTVRGDGTFSKDVLTSQDFVNGVAIVEFTGTSDEDVIIRSTYGRAKADSLPLRAKLFSDLSSAHDSYPAVSFLFRKGTIQGYPDGSFKPSKTVTRVEALKLIFSGLDKATQTNGKLSFRDTSNGQWYSNYVATAAALKIVQGYPDGSFKPEQGVNRVEFLKMLFSATDVEVESVVLEKPYEDVDQNAWFAPYVQFAKEKNLFPNTGNRFHPNNPMDRIEVAEVIYRLLVLQANEAVSFDSLLRVPSLD